MSTVGRSGVGRHGCDASVRTITYASATTPKAPRSSRPPWGPTASSSSITTYVAADRLVRGPTDTLSAGRCTTRTPITHRARRSIVCATNWGDALRAVELRYPERTGEIYYLMHEPEQRWYFASNMTVDEAWLFKNFDSAPPGPGRAAPHSAFTDPRHPNVPPRESVEVRALALFP